MGECVFVGVHVAARMGDWEGGAPPPNHVATIMHTHEDTSTPTHPRLTHDSPPTHPRLTHDSPTTHTHAHTLKHEHTRMHTHRDTWARVHLSASASWSPPRDWPRPGRDSVGPLLLRHGGQREGGSTGGGVQWQGRLGEEADVGMHSLAPPPPPNTGSGFGLGSGSGFGIPKQTNTHQNVGVGHLVGHPPLLCLSIFEAP